MILAVSEDVSGLPKSDEEKKIEKVMGKAWAAFAADPTNGLSEKLGWPKYDTESK